MNKKVEILNYKTKIKGNKEIFNLLYISIFNLDKLILIYKKYYHYLTLINILG